MGVDYNLEPMDFDSADLIEIEFTIGDEEYVLREASEDAACIYRNALMDSTKFNDSGAVVGASKLADAEPLLLSHCVFKVERDAQRVRIGFKPVSLQQVRGWPARVVKPLFERLKEISDLAEVATAKLIKCPHCGEEFSNEPDKNRPTN